MQRLHGFQKRFGIRHARFGGAPVGAVRAGVRHVERLLARASIHRIVQGDPVVRAHADIDEHAQRRARGCRPSRRRPSGCGGTGTFEPSAISSIWVGLNSRLKIELMAFGLLMWSVAKRDVSDVPAGWRLPTCQRKSVDGMRRLNRRPSSQNWLPIVPARFAHRGSSGFSGGLSGLNPMWQKPQVMPIR